MQMQKNDILKILDLVHKSLDHWIGMADPKRFSWRTTAYFGCYDGEWQHLTSDEQTTFTQTMTALQTIPTLEYATSWKEAGDTHFLYGNGLLKPVKYIPEDAFKWLVGLKSIFTDRGNCYDGFFMTPITIDIDYFHVSYYLGVDDSPYWANLSRIIWESIATCWQHAYNVEYINLHHLPQFWQQIQVDPFTLKKYPFLTNK